MADLTDALADQPLAAEGLTFEFDLLISEAVSATETWTPRVIPGGLVTETAKATDSTALNDARLNQTLVDDPATATSDVWRVGRTLALSANVSVSEHWAASVTPTIVERAKATATLGVSLSRNLSLAESLKATEAWAYSDVKNVTDSATASDSVTYAYVAGIQVDETATAVESYAPTRVVNFGLVERVLASDSPQDNYIYSVTMIETVYASVPYQEPSGSISTWAINTRTNAVTEYHNFDFVSFANMGRKYLAASPDGLYELDGATDNGQDVVAQMAGGFFQPNGMKQARLKGVYLSVGGQGRGAAVGTWGLTLTMGDGRTYVYQRVSNPGLMVTKFNMGKGLHANQMAWSITNVDGQDFDLDRIEFVPMMSGRRVG